MTRFFYALLIAFDAHFVYSFREGIVLHEMRVHTEASGTYGHANHPGCCTSSYPHMYHKFCYRLQEEK